NRLAGNDPTFSVTGSSLQQAGLMSKTISNSDADSIASSIRSLAQTMLAMRQGGSSGTADFSAVELRRFTMDFSTPGRPRVLQMSPEDAPTLVQRAAAGEGVFASWFSDAFGDVKHYFSNAIGDLESITLDVGQEIQTIVMDVEKNVQSFVLTTVDQM